MNELKNERINRVKRTDEQKKKKKRFFRPNYVSWFPGNSPLEYFLERARAFPSWNSRHGNRVQSQFHAAGHLEPSRATSKSARRKKNEAWSLVVSATDQTMEKDPRVFPSTFPKFSHPFSRTSRRTLATIQRRRSRCTPRFSLIILDESDPLPPPRQIISAVRSDRNLKTEDEGEKTKKHGGERFSRVSDSVQ